MKRTLGKPIPEKVWKTQLDEEERDFFEKTAFLARETGKPQGVYFGDILFGSIWPSGAFVLIDAKVPLAKKGDDDDPPPSRGQAARTQANSFDAKGVDKQ